MKQVFTAFALIAILFSYNGKYQSPSDAVNVFNGTDFHGHTYPGATTPFGLVQLSPDTRTYGWDGCSGYHYSDSAILGFSHTHLSGTGCADLGDFLFTPGLGEGVPGPLAFSHSDENACPGYYKVVFPSGIRVELTASPRVGLHRYSFSGEGARKILIDATHCIGEGSKATTALLEAVSDKEVCGKRVVTGWIPDRECYLSASFSEPFTAEDAGEGKLLLDFGKDVKEITVKAGISFNSAQGAKENRIAEAGELGFDEILAITKDDWGSALGSIIVSGGPVEQFYTCLYHTLVTPNRIDDVTPGGVKYSTLSLWDTFRSWNPLQTIINPGLVSDMVESMLEMYRSWGELPIWPLAHGETGCMIGYHSVPVIADAWLRGIRTFDGEEALRAMVESSCKNKDNNSALYIKYGYLPADMKGQSVSQTLEYAYDDWCIARMAEDLGHEEIAAEYYARAASYRNVFDPSTGFMRGRRSKGNWMTPFDPISSTRDYTEAIPWQARFFVPHDHAGLEMLFGSRENMVAALDSLFTYEERSENVHVSDITGLMGQYAHGNEPSHHMAYIYNWVGEPSKSQATVRRLLTEMYSTEPDGVCGNEDCGQMSAWYILSSLGIYPACPGSGEYILAAPLFKEANIALGNGNTLKIKADKPFCPYISDVLLNGSKLERNYVTYDEIMAGGTLEFKLSATPDHSRDDLPAPYSMTTEGMVSPPAIVGHLELFDDVAKVEMSSRTPGARIHYTLDGSEPCENSTLYEGPFDLDKSAPIRAKAFKDGMQPSPEAFLQAEKAYYREASKVSGLKNGCRYSYHRGVFSQTADVLASPVAARGVMQRPTLREAPDEDHFGYIFSGYLDISEDGIWDFCLISDDGSVLEIDGSLVVDNDGTHSALATFGRIPLKKGLHPFRLIYLEDYEGQRLAWLWKAPGAERMSPIRSENIFYK